MERTFGAIERAAGCFCRLNEKESSELAEDRERFDKNELFSSDRIEDANLGPNGLKVDFFNREEHGSLVELIEVGFVAAR